MSRAFVKEDSGGNDRAKRYALLPAREKKPPGIIGANHGFTRTCV